jgi:hypothetical protein
MILAENIALKADSADVSKLESNLQQVRLEYNTQLQPAFIHYKKSTFINTDTIGLFI